MKLIRNAQIFLRTLCVVFAFAGAAQAAEHGTAAEAEAMVKKVVAEVKAQGADKTYSEITAGKMFRDRDLYIVVFDLNGKNLAHGFNPKLVGKDLSAAKDPDGKPFVKLLIDVAKTKGMGWSEPFKFLNPESQTIESKSMYVERVGDVLVGCGVYKN